MYGCVVENGRLIEVRGDAETIVVPNNVTVIFSDAFSCKRLLKNIVIPEGVECICDNAFFYASSLEKITFPSTLIEIGESAFESCSSLKEIELPNGLKILGKSAFKNCSSLTKAIIPGTLKHWGIESFYHCSGLKEVTIHSGITELPQETFRSCCSLKKVQLPDTLHTIRSNCFRDCEELEQLYLPESLISLGFQAFSRCKSLKYINIPQGINELYDGVFDECNSLEAIELPEKLTAIGAWTFGCCAKLQAINIPKSVRRIGGDAFFGCKSLEAIELPEKLTAIDDSAFSCCAKLQAINIPKSVRIIGEEAFYGCESLQRISWPSPAKQIKGQVFHNCIALREVILPNGLKGIGEGAFKNCTSLESIDIPDSVVKIHKEAFANAGVIVEERHEPPKEKVPAVKLSKEQEAEALILESNGTRIYTIGEDVYVASLNKKLSWAIKEQKTNKTCKSLPDALCAKQFALLKKHYSLRISEEVKNHLSIFISGKPIKNWAIAYRADPVLNILAQVLIWTCSNGCFIVFDGQCVDYRGEPVTIAGNVMLAHPAEMTAEECSGWRAFLKAQKISQPFVQIEEKVIEADTITIDRYFRPTIKRDEFEKFAQMGICVKYRREKKSRINLYFDAGGHEIFSKVPPIKEIWVDCEGIILAGPFQNNGGFAFAPNDIDVWHPLEFRFPVNVKKRTINHMIVSLDNIWQLNS